MIRNGLERHQLAGVDERERGFSRPVEFERAGASYRAILRYESVRVTTELRPTADLALRTLIQTLHNRGYRQLRSQLSVRHGVYLGSQEIWVDYPDPDIAKKPSGFVVALRSWFVTRVPSK